jgi:hypothetical protein
MASLITITSADEIFSVIFTNVHVFNETSTAINFKPKLIVWRDEFFPILDGGNPGQKTALLWAVPTAQLINSMLTPNIEPPSYMDPVINMVQNTISGFTSGNNLTAPQLDAMVVAFNNAWT